MDTVECHKDEEPPSEQSKLHFQSSGLGSPTQEWNHQTKVSDVIQDSPRPQGTSLTHFSKSRSVWKCPRCCLNFLLEVNFNHRCENDWGSNIQWNGYSRKGREEGEKVKNNTSILESRHHRAESLQDSKLWSWISQEGLALLPVSGNLS